MGTRKSMANMIMDPAIHSTPISSSLRRKSVLRSKSINNSILSENDDEAERLARRHEINVTSTPVTTINTNDRRRSLGLSFLMHIPTSKMVENISQCIKLETQNKINLKNAFSLEMIDFMTYMIKKQDANMSNLQVASTSLDVSTKIYGYRVDGVHTEILQMIDGLDKQVKHNNNTEEMDVQEGSETQLKTSKKKKRKNKQEILTTVEALRTNVVTEKPSLVTMEADIQTTDMLYQAMLPNHANSRYYLHPYTDVLVDIIECEEIQCRNVVYDVPGVEDFSHMEICPPLSYFNFQSWIADDETENVLPENTNKSRFQFDLDASLSCNDKNLSTATNCFDIEENEEATANKFVTNPNLVKSIVDFQEVLTTSLPTKVSEYSYIQKNVNMHWAGPSHWKITNLKKVLSNNEVMGTCRQAPIRKRKKIELCYNKETIESVKAKFLSNQANMYARITKVDWKEEKLTLPPDKRYDIIQIKTLYLHMKMFAQPESRDKPNATYLPNTNSYSCTNENDTHYYPESNNNEGQENEETIINDDVRSTDEGVLGLQMPFTRNNLVAIPKLTNKVSIAYCARAKKVDMRQLKQSIWKCLTADSDGKITNMQRRMEENIQQDAYNKISGRKHFSKIYKELPNILTKTNIEALSYPISFVSLLHLANEKRLQITSSPDMSELFIEQN